MTALADTGAPPRGTKARNGLLCLKIRGGTARTFYAGALVGHRSGSNLAELPLSASARTDLVIRGCVRNEITITTAVGDDGEAVDADGHALTLDIEPGILLGFDTGSGGDQILATDIGKRCYAYDSNTIYKTSLGDTLSPAGVIHDVDADGLVALDVEEDPLTWMVEGNAVEVVELEDDLAATSNGNGASMVGIEDAGAFTAAGTVEAALAEIYQDLKSTLGVIVLKPSDFYLLTGAPLAVFADGTTTVPGSVFIESKGFAVQWNNDAAPAAITSSFLIPSDMDITVDPVVHARVAKIGATNNAGNTTTLAVGLFNQVDAATYIADTDFGGASSALLPAATTKTLQNLTRTITAADLAAYPASVTITVKPTAGTLNTDDLLLFMVYVVYKRKPRAS